MEERFLCDYRSNELEYRTNRKLKGDSALSEMLGVLISPNKFGNSSSILIISERKIIYFKKANRKIRVRESNISSIIDWLRNLRLYAVVNILQERLNKLTQKSLVPIQLD